MATVTASSRSRASSNTGSRSAAPNASGKALDLAGQVPEQRDAGEQVSGVHPHGHHPPLRRVRTVLPRSLPRPIGLETSRLGASPCVQAAGPPDGPGDRPSPRRRSEAHASSGPGALSC
jgi:hypothetical protein